MPVGTQHTPADWAIDKAEGCRQIFREYKKWKQTISQRKQKTVANQGENIMTGKFFPNHMSEKYVDFDFFCIRFRQDHLWKENHRVFLPQPYLGWSPVRIGQKEGIHSETLGLSGDLGGNEPKNI